MSFKISEWYLDLGSYSFPTVFIYLGDKEKDALLTGDQASAPGQNLLGRIAYVIDHLPGASFIHADVCAPTDSPTFKEVSGGTKVARTAWRMLQESEKVRTALRTGETERIGLHPYRRIDHSREFRLFVKNRQLVGISQRFLNRHHPRLERRREEIWERCAAFVNEIGFQLLADDCSLDVYLTSTARLMLISMGPWGEPTAPLLFRDWDREWPGNELLLMPKPMRLRGDVSVSF